MCLFLGWNKALAFREALFFEAVVERWMYLHGQLINILGDELEDMMNFIYGWIDICVHSMQPETEVLHRETFQAVHVAKAQRFNASEKYALHLFLLGVDANAMLALDEAWYFALQTHCPYFEDCDFNELQNQKSAPLVKFFRRYILTSYWINVVGDLSFLSICAPLGIQWKAKIASVAIELGNALEEMLCDEQPDFANYFSAEYKGTCRNT